MIYCVPRRFFSEQPLLPRYLPVGELISGTDGRSPARSSDSYIDRATTGRTDRRDLGVAIDCKSACCCCTKGDPQGAGEASADDDNCSATSLYPAGWADACDGWE